MSIETGSTVRMNPDPLPQPVPGTLSLVIPVYGNEESIPDLLKTISSLSRDTAGALEAILVVDGSPDRSADLLGEGLLSLGVPAQLLVLSRNFGSFAAIRAGLTAGRGEFFAVMAADLQEPPELVLEFRRRLSSGRCDLVVGTRQDREDPGPSRAASRAFWSAYRMLVQPEVPAGGVDVFACTRAFRDQLLSLQESNSTLVGLLFWLGFRREEVPYVRRRRMYGRSGWSFSRKLRYLLDSAFAFTDLPLRMLTIAGGLGIMVSVTLGLVTLVARATGHIPVPGYAATILVVMFFGGLNSLGLGLLGEYVWRAFENTKGRPAFLVAAHRDFPAAGAAPENQP